MGGRSPAHPFQHSFFLQCLTFSPHFQLHFTLQSFLPFFLFFAIFFLPLRLSVSVFLTFSHAFSSARLHVALRNNLPHAGLPHMIEA